METQPRYIPNLPRIYSDTKLQDSLIAYPEEKLWKRLILSGVSLGCAATAIACKVMNYRNWNRNPLGNVGLSFVSGVSLQHAVQVALPRQMSNIFKSFVGDYATPLFLWPSEVYNNLNNRSRSPFQAPIFSSLTGLGGMCTAAFVHALFSRRLSEIDEIAGLQSQEFPKKTYLKVTGPYRRASRVAWNVVKLAFGVGGIFLGTYYPPAKILRDYSIMFVGGAVGQLSHELWIKMLEPINRKIIETATECDIKDVRALEKKVDFYFKFMKVFWVAAHFLPGILIAFSGGVQKAKWPMPIAWGGYFTTGLTLGMKRHLELIRFTELPIEDLREIRRGVKPLSTIEKVFYVCKWIHSTVGVGGFIGLGLAGFSFQSMNFQPVALFDRVALGAFAVGLYGFYAAGRVAKSYFDPYHHNTPLRNMAYFFTHYSPGIPMLALYLMEKMDIGDEALNDSSTFTGILMSAAYLSLGCGIGLEAAGRGEYPHPRTFSSTSAALIFRFIIEEMTKQV